MQYSRLEVYRICSFIRRTTEISSAFLIQLKLQLQKTFLLSVLSLVQYSISSVLQQIPSDVIVIPLDLILNHFSDIGKAQQCNELN